VEKSKKEHLETITLHLEQLNRIWMNACKKSTTDSCSLGLPESDSKQVLA